MWKLGKRIIKAGRVSETLNVSAEDVTVVGELLHKNITRHFARALAIRLVDAGSCNACELEINAMNNPFYNLERYGVGFVASPRHADMLLVTGPVTKNMREALIKTYEAIPDPKLVVAVGDCAHCGGVFKDSYAIENGLLGIIPVTTVIKGCPPTPVQIITGILQAIKCCN